jgi:hypothetical protein
VDHLCYKCQTSIDETLPFCPHCGAPQIRVATPDEDVPAQPNTATPYVSPSSWPPASQSHQPNAIQWNLAAKGAMLAGLISAGLSALPIMGLGCCLWLLGAGALAVWLYQQRIPGTSITPGMGMRIGALSGAIGFLATTVWWVFLFTRNSKELRTVFAEQMEKAIAQNPDPHAQEAGRQVISYLNTPEGLATAFVVAIVVMAVVFIMFSAAGGALGASMFARRRSQR